jgi:GntR family transcriptional regulator of arabinose operon
LQELKYQKIIDWITGEIESGQLRPGDRLMTEEQLSDRFESSRQTVRKATQALVEQEILIRVQGSGTYIGEHIQKRRETKHMNVAVVSTFYESYIFPRTMRGIEKALSQGGYAMQVAFTDNDISNESKILQNLLEKNNIDGLIAEPSCGALPNRNIRFYRELLERNIPVIFFNDSYPDIDIPCVRLDDEAIAGDATRLLIEAGHKKIAGIFKLDDGQGRRRYSGYLNAVAEAGLQHKAENVIWIDTELQKDMSRQEEYIFERMKGCTGVVCYNDQIAKQVIDMCMTRNIRVPEDLSVVGIDDSDLSELSRVGITSFPHPLEALGEKVVSNLMKLMEDPTYDANYLFKVKPVIRESICKRES